MQVKPSIPSRVEYKLNCKRESSSFITGAPKHKNEPKYRREYITLSYFNKKQGNPEDGKPEECTLCQLSKTTLTSTRALPVGSRQETRSSQYLSSTAFSNSSLWRWTDDQGFAKKWSIFQNIWSFQHQHIYWLTSKFVESSNLPAVKRYRILSLLGKAINKQNNI